MEFHHQDGEGDFLRILTHDGERKNDRHLRIGVRELDAHEDDYMEVLLLETDARRLRDALTGWLDGPGTVPATLTPADVRAIVAEAIAEERTRVQPLHRSPQATEGAGFCQILGCKLFPGVVQHFEHDPEPLCGCCHHRNDLHDGTDGCLFGSEGGSEICGCTAQRDPEPRDVGHPEPEPLCNRLIPAGAHFASRCTFCGWLWLQHKPIGVLCRLCQAPWTDGHGQPGDPCAGAPRQLVGCECGHGWGVHVRGLDCTGHGGTCKCTRARIGGSAL